MTRTTFSLGEGHPLLSFPQLLTARRGLLPSPADTDAGELGLSCREGAQLWEAPGGWPWRERAGIPGLGGGLWEVGGGALWPPAILEAQPSGVSSQALALSYSGVRRWSRETGDAWALGVGWEPPSEYLVSYGRGRAQLPLDGTA